MLGVSLFFLPPLVPPLVPPLLGVELSLSVAYALLAKGYISAALSSF
jgi:hypothetical protein